MPEPKPHPARYWKKGDGEKLVCFLCPRQCRLNEGQRGFCFVRQNLQGQLILTTYGRSSGFCIDPIEKKPLNHFYPGTGTLSFGTTGCNLGCKFCQNWDISKSKEAERAAEHASPEMIAQAALEFKCQSVAFTYNDPVIFTEYALDVAAACHAKGIKTVAVTAGYISDLARKDFFSGMDATNVDLKAFSEEFYQKFAAAKLQPVLDTLSYLKEKTKVWLEITTLLISGQNDSDEELKQMTAWISQNLGHEVPLHFSAFHPAFQMTEYEATPAATLTRARDIALANGLQYVYTGNVHDKKGSSTYCASCHKLLIERDWYELGEYHLKNKNQCEYCSTVCAGHFATKPGNWGAKRLPINL